MTTIPSNKQVNLARIALAVLLGLILLGAVLHGLSVDVFRRGWQNILQRSGGPMSLRFFLQPAMAVLLAVHDGINDARLHRPPYIWTLLTHPAGSGPLLREALIVTARPILLALAVDGIYQGLVLHAFYPGEMAAIAVVLAFVPYLLLRGPVERLARLFMKRARRDNS